MRKKWNSYLFILGVLLFILLLTRIWPTISVLMEGNVRYSEREDKYYQLLTDQILKSCPRISKDYVFGYAIVEGPAVEISSITFSGTTNIEPVYQHLTSQGFAKKREDERGEYWEAKNSNKMVHIWITDNPPTTIIEVIK